MRNRGLTFMLLACAGVALVAACGARSIEEARADSLQPLREATPQPAAPDVGASLTKDEEALNQSPLKLPLAEPRVVVEKGARRLRLYAGGEVVRFRRVVLGFEPAGDKARQGDGRTPEGDFFVCMKNERSKFYLSLGLNYPRREDAERGLRDGLITRAQYRGIVRAAAARRCPPWDTPLGGEIFIHGGGTSSDWTAGCVALENPEIRELFDSVPAGTPVRIEP